jgi:DNA replication initiation complex subunit (GINS family)
MAQGEFTKEEAERIIKVVTEMFGAISKSKRPNYIGHLNDVFLFIDAAEKVAPLEEK